MQGPRPCDLHHMALTWANNPGKTLEAPARGAPKWAKYLKGQGIGGEGGDNKPWVSSCPTRPICCNFTIGVATASHRARTRVERARRRAGRGSHPLWGLPPDAGAPDRRMAAQVAIEGWLLPALSRRLAPDHGRPGIRLPSEIPGPLRASQGLAPWIGRTRCAPGERSGHARGPPGPESEGAS